jgi:hypothetical protein
MARCGCSGASCSCLVQGEGAVSVSGTGSVSSPYVVSANFNLVAVDTPTIDLSITGDGSPSNPWQLSAATALQLGEISDVDLTGVTTGYVLARQANGTYKFVAPTTAPVGAITLSGTGGLLGDGSGGNPLGIKLAPSSGLTLDATGLKVTGAGSDWTTYTPTWAATTTNPTLGNGTLQGAYSAYGKAIDVSISLITGSTTKRGAGRWTFSLPQAPKSRLMCLSMYLYLPGIANYVGTAKIDSGLIYAMNIATSTASSTISHSTPASMPTGSQLILTGTYEAN